MALGGEPGWLPERPKGMHRTTYERHVEELDDELMRWVGQRFPGMPDPAAPGLGPDEPEAERE